MTDTLPAPADAGPPLPGTAYSRAQLPTLLRERDVASAATPAPDFTGCPLRGQIATLTNLLMIERAMVDAARDKDRAWWDELVRAHDQESRWLTAFQIHERVRGV